MNPTSTLTFADLEQMPEAPGKQELIDGELIELPPAKIRHMIVSERVYDILRSGAVGNRAHIEMGYRIAGGWLVPDVSVTRRNQETSDDYYLRSPELAVEILSPTNKASYIERKLKLYFEEGAEEVWVINPSKLTMHVHRHTPTGVIHTVVEGEHKSKFATITLATLFAAESPGSLII